MIEYGLSQIGSNPQIFDPVIIGFPSRNNIGKTNFSGTVIGDNPTIRSGTVLYSDVNIGSDFSTGHNVMVREHTTIGNHVSLGTSTIIEGNTVIGDHCNIQSMVYIPTNTTIGSHVFIGPNTVFTNDKYPPHGGDNLIGPTIYDYAAIGGNVTILPGVRIGSGALIAAGSVVTKDVPPKMLAIGNPARIKPLPQGVKL